MRKLIAGLILASIGTAAFADTYVRGYTRRDGTYVAPHYRSDANGTTSDNWSTRGNVNPYTGQVGTRNPYGSQSTPYGGYNPYQPQPSGSLYDPD